MAPRSEDPELITRVITCNFELTQHIRPRYVNVTERQTVGRTTSRSNIALCTILLRAKQYVHRAVKICQCLIKVGYFLAHGEARGVYRGRSGSGEGKNSTLKGERIPPDIWLIHNLYVFTCAGKGSHLQLGVRTSLIFVVSYITARCTPT